MLLLLVHCAGEDVSPGKDGGIIRSILSEGSGYQSPNDYASVSGEFEHKSI